MNIQGWFPLWLTDLIFLQSKGLSRVFSNTTVQKHQFFSTQLSFVVQLSRPYMTTGKTIALTRRTFVDKVMSLLFNMLSKAMILFIIHFTTFTEYLWVSHCEGKRRGTKLQRWRYSHPNIHSTNISWVPIMFQALLFLLVAQLRLSSTSINSII